MTEYLADKNTHGIPVGKVIIEALSLLKNQVDLVYDKKHFCRTAKPAKINLFKLFQVCSGYCDGHVGLTTVRGSTNDCIPSFKRREGKFTLICSEF